MISNYCLPVPEAGRRNRAASAGAVAGPAQRLPAGQASPPHHRPLPREEREGERTRGERERIRGRGGGGGGGEG